MQIRYTLVRIVEDVAFPEQLPPAAGYRDVIMDMVPAGLVVDVTLTHSVISNVPSADLKHASRILISVIAPSDNSTVLHSSGGGGGL